MYSIVQKQNEEKIRLEFRLENCCGQDVMLAGSFNDWMPVPMTVDAATNCAVIVLELVPDYYEYRFVVDGKWITDESNPEISANDFGTLNSVLDLR